MSELGNEIIVYILIALFALSIGIVPIILLLPYINGEADHKKRLSALSGNREVSLARKLLGTEMREVKGERRKQRKQIKDTLQQLSQKSKEQKKRLTIKTMMRQAGIGFSVQAFWLLSLGFGAIIFVFVLLANLGEGIYPGLGLIVAVAAGFTAAFGVPRWLVAIIRKRRMQAFLEELADAIDVMVRGIRAGLPLSDTLQVIAAERGAPVGPEFAEVFEGQRIGIAIDQGFERMFERVPLPEVNFLAVVIAIQSKTGGNLGEALNNLSTVLRDRKKMKARIRALSQEAKTSAAIIGAIPFVFIGLIHFVRPGYITVMFTDKTGQMMLVGCLIWMAIGVLIMRKMINLDI